MNNNLTQLTLHDAQQCLHSKKFTSQELVAAHIEQCKNHKHLNAFITTLFEQAMIEAKKADDNIAKGKFSPMTGLPIAHKDIFCTKDIKTTAGSKILGNFIPPYESTITQKMRDDGFINLGKLNMDEFAMGSGNLNSAFGPVVNPLKASDNDEDLVPGGSSGGSSAAVAADMALAATGTDTGGSIRQPASFCGLVGIKPTYGRCSRYGIIAFASSFDQAGAITKTVADSALMLQSMAGHDIHDSTSVDIAVPQYIKSIGTSIKGKKVGVAKEFYCDGMSDSIVNMWDQGKKILEDAGAQIVEVSLPLIKYCLPAYYIMAPAEASSNLARYDGVRYGLRQELADGDDLNAMYEKTRNAGFGDEVTRRILMGTFVLSAESFDMFYRKAACVRRVIHNQFNEIFEKVDVLLSPTTPNSAFSLHNPTKDPVMMYMNDILTVPANLAGLPALSVPTAWDERGLPISLQLFAPAFCEPQLFAFGDIIEKNSGFKLKDAPRRNTA